jgi:hypothetical protein
MDAPKEPTISTVDKVERKSPRSKFWVVKKFMREFFGVDEARRNKYHDIELETVSADLSRDHAYSFCEQLNREEKEREKVQAAETGGDGMSEFYKEDLARMQGKPYPQLCDNPNCKQGPAGTRKTIQPNETGYDSKGKRYCSTQCVTEDAPSYP